MESSTNDFPYGPIDSDEGEIRLLRIQPAKSKDDPIYCEISHVSLKSDVDFVTLSYMWGDPKITRPIHLRSSGGCTQLTATRPTADVNVQINQEPNEKQSRLFQITTNLYAALQEIRTSFHSRSLWIDAICINQSDSRERESQVAMMTRIYSSATFSLVWLGAADPPCDSAVAVLQYPYSSDTDISTEELRTRINRVDIGRLEQTLKELLYLFSLPVWSRIWLLQEVVVAAELIILYGHRAIPGAAFMALLHLNNKCASSEPGSIVKFDRFPREMQLHYESAWLVWWHRWHRWHHLGLGPSTVSHYLSTLGNNMVSTDSRDRVYAILGIISDNVILRPDYNRSSCYVFCDFVYLHMTHHKNLKLLEHATNNYRFKDVDGDILPSWAHNFADHSEGLHSIGWDIQPLYKAGIAEHPTHHCHLQRRDDLTIFIKGVVADRVHTITADPLAQRKRAIETNQDPPWQQVFTRPPAPEGLPNPYRSENVEAVYWRTLICDLNPGSNGRINKDELDMFHIAAQSITSGGSPVSPKTSQPRLQYSPEKVAATADLIKFAFGLTGRSIWFGYTESGYMAMLPDGTRAGDQVCVFFDSEVPYVIRKIASGYASSDDDVFEIVGPAYVHGMMDGEVIEWVKDGKITERRFIIA